MTAPGETLALVESQYRFGVGPIVLQSVELLAQVEFDGAPWWQIRAVVANGTPANHGGWATRNLYVDAAALPGAERQ
jgi:hypothetical protein